MTEARIHKTLNSAASFQTVSSILVCSIRLIGDVILTTPLIGLLKGKYPAAAIDILVASGTGSFLERDRRIRRILTVPSKQVEETKTSGVTHTSLLQLFQRYDIAITMNASDRGNLAAICAGKKERIGFYENNGILKSGWKKLFLSKPLHYNTSEHIIMHSRHVAEACGIDVEKLEVAIYWNESDTSKVGESLKNVGSEQRYFVIHPFARWEYKYWDMDAVVRLSDMIASRYELIPVWTSSPDPAECAGLHKYSAKCTIKPKVIPGIFSLNQMACLIEGAALYIGLDTAVTHIAASTGVPLVALYGPTETYRWFPWNNSGTLDQLQKCPRGNHRNGNTILIQNECRHPNCIRPQCTNRCMQRISVDDVFTAAETLLQENLTNRHTSGRETSA